MGCSAAEQRSGAGDPVASTCRTIKTPAICSIPREGQDLCTPGLPGSWSSPSACARGLLVKLSLSADVGRASLWSGLSEDERVELHRLHDANAKLRMEREILRKAAVFFAKKDGR